MSTQKSVWTPQPMQAAYVHCPVEEIFYGGARGGGKGLPKSEIVATPDGFVRLGDIRVGDVICDTEGGLQTVLGVYDRGPQPAYEVELCDGHKIICDGDHRWGVNFPGTSRKKMALRKVDHSTVTTLDLLKRSGRRSGKRNIFAPKLVRIKPVYFNKKLNIPIDPYIMGLIIGDGSVPQSKFVTQKIYVGSADIEIMQHLASAGWSYKRKNRKNSKKDFYEATAKADVKRGLVELGVYASGYNSYTKYIPAPYKTSSYGDRLSLLQGMMDTDGCAGIDGSAKYDTVSERLADDVVDLVRSIGGVAKKKHYSQKVREKSYGKTVAPIIYRVHIRLPDNRDLFRLERKKLRCKVAHETPTRSIVRITPVGLVPTVCIKVSHPNEMFLISGFVPTKNTDGSLGRAMIRALQYKEHFKAYFVRRELVQLEPAIARSKEIFSSFGTYLDHKKTWIFRDGGVLSFRYIERDSDAEKFQGASATDLYIEEIGNFPDLDPLLKLKGILRSTAGVPTCWCATGNPGGPGHTLVKRRWIDPAPNGFEVIRETDPLTGLSNERIYIPARVTDNMLLMQNDPGYIARLSQTGSEALVRAWLSGSFDVIDGAFFSSFSVQRNVLRPAELPAHWLRFCAGDWGSYFPFYFIWFAHASEDWVHPDGQFIPKGALIGFREWYGSQNHNNKGLKMTAPDVAKELARIEREIKRQVRRNNSDDVIAYRVLDPKAFSQDGGESIAERFARSTDGEILFRRADNKRVGKDGAMGGWDFMRQRIDGTDLHGDGTKIPSLYFFDTCVDAIRTIPALQHDPDNPEDLMGSEDHPADAIRYGIMSRPYLEDAPRKKPTREELRDSILKGDLKNATLMELFNERERSMKGSRSRNWRV